MFWSWEALSCSPRGPGIAAVMRHHDLVDVEAVSDELYGLPLDQFIPTRTVREKQAGSAGDKDVAAQIHRLVKPNLVAWLSNQLVRESAGEIRPLLELGAGLREATATSSGEQLRELSRQQRQLVHSLVQQARRLANAAGRNVSSQTARDLESTLRAALADPDAAEALAGGRLTEGMHNSGLGSHSGLDRRPMPSPQWPATPTADSVRDRRGTQEHRREAEDNVADAEDNVADAEVIVKKAITARQATYDLLEAANQGVTTTAARVERARRELDEALAGHSGAVKNQRRARATFDRADLRARDAQRLLADVTERLNRSAP